MYRLLKKSVESYHSQKEFIENASHELQTPLAISINKLELMAENANLLPEQMEERGTVLNSLERLARLNKSLLLLSRIENRQFVEEENINWNGQVKKVMAEFEDFASHQQVEIFFSEDVVIEHTGNRDLAGILISNLIKNSLLHTPHGTAVEIRILPKMIRFENFGNDSLDEGKIFSRFKGAEKVHSTGLGLAISKAIAERYGLELIYYFSEQKHIFTLRF